MKTAPKKQKTHDASSMKFNLISDYNSKVSEPLKTLQANKSVHETIDDYKSQTS